MTFDTAAISTNSDSHAWTLEDTVFSGGRVFDIAQNNNTAGKNTPPKLDNVFDTKHLDNCITHSNEFNGDVEYSKAVYFRFWVFLTCLLMSGVFSVFALVSEVKNFAVVGAFLLALSGVAAVTWLGRAKRERQQQSHN